MLTGLYNIIIMPLVLVMEFVFSVMYRLFQNAGVAIMGVSAAVNILSFPLYRRADAIQDEERRIQKVMAEPLKHIKKTFKGDERFMMLQEYYRQLNYSPLFVFRGSLPLLLQIPFFTAAYNYLSNLSLLNGQSFLFINDMGSPDRLLTLFGITINVLPILMTAINLISGAIYTKGFAFKDKAQLYILALVFLVFLYNRPSGLVFYWTLNNLFSLCKNIFLKLVPEPRKTLAFLLGEAGLAFAVFFISTGRLVTAKRAVILIMVFCLLNLPRTIVYLKSRSLKSSGRPGAVLKNIRSALDSFFDTELNYGRIFLCGALSLTIVYGLLIPMSVISSSPEDFVSIYHYMNPLYYVVSTACIASGFFLLWCGAVIHFFGNKRVKQVQAYIFSLLTAASLMNFLFFGKNLGTLSDSLEFTKAPEYGLSAILINLLVLIVLLTVLTLVYRYKNSVVRYFLIMVILTGVVYTTYESLSVNSRLSKISDIRQAKAASSVTPDNVEKILRLSREGKNVVVFFLDRAISGYIPYIFNEKPGLNKQFAGFTYYPNTISFGEHTVFGAPALYGGYEYMPSAINERADVSLEQKVNEADLLMPVLFSREGYITTTCDPAQAGLKKIPDLSVFDDYPEIHTYNTRRGEYVNLLTEEELAARHDEIPFRNYFWYSIFKTAPLLLQKTIYDSGSYFGTTVKTLGNGFLSNYSVLKSLPLLTDILEGEKGAFFMINNLTPHSPSLLQMPDYVPAGNVNNGELDDPSRFTLNGRTVNAYKDEMKNKYHYHASMSALLRLGTWFDYLRENGIYDNTRIIIVADHGYFLGQFEDMIVDDTLDVEAVNPLLMVKDFDSKEYTVDNTFMTNADVPAIAMKDIIKDPVNPFTGNPVNSEAKEKEQMFVTTSHNFELKDQLENTLNIEPDSWYTVKDDIFNLSNWKKAAPQMP